MTTSYPLTVSGVLTSGSTGIPDAYIIIYVKGGLAGGTWEPHAYPQTGPGGSYSVDLPRGLFSKQGSYEIRADFAPFDPKSQYTPCSSEVLSLTVIQHPAALTISSSTDLLMLGSSDSAIISGTLSSVGLGGLEAKNVYLIGTSPDYDLASVYHSDWIPIGWQVTGSGGSYSFSVPVTNTIFSLADDWDFKVLYGSEPDSLYSVCNSSEVHIRGGIANPTSLSISVDPSSVEISTSETATISGALTMLGAGVEAQPVALYIKGGTYGDTWTYCANTMTDKVGGYLFQINGAFFTTCSPFQLKVVFPYGSAFNPIFASSQSNTVPLNVNPNPSLQTTTLDVSCTPDTLPIGSTTTISGHLLSIASGIDGKPVTVYLQNPGSSDWRSIGTASTDTDGYYQLAYDMPGVGNPAGIYHLKAVFQVESGYNPAESSTDDISVAAMIATPEYGFGGFVGLLACLASFAVFKVKCARQRK